MRRMVAEHAGGVGAQRRARGPGRVRLDPADGTRVELRRHAFPELLHAVEPGARARRVRGALAFERGFELLQQFALLRIELDRRFHHHAADQIADVAVAHVAHAFAAQAERLAGLRFGRDADGGVAAERRHREFRAERRLREPDRHFAIQIVAFALEDRVFAHVHFDVQIARRRAGRTGLAFAAETDAVAAVDAGRDLHRERLVALHAAFAAAGLARIR